MEIKIPAPVWDHPIIDIIVDLEKLRTKLLGWDVPPYIFFQLKTIFQMLETLWSARIEGNNTTLAEYIENIIEKEWLENNKKNWQQELFNIDQSIKYIEESNLEELLINRKYLSDLHILVTQDLPPPPKWEWSNYPGQWRPHNVAIQNSKHVPVDSTILPEYMDEFIRFINTPYPEKNQLLMVAVAHHSFANIHPFDNGNGRLWRLLNYALLIKLWFQVKNGRLLNPSSVFYSDRDVYYNMLWKADSLEDNDMLDRCSYFSYMTQKWDSQNWYIVTKKICSW
jgi:Fic family protein